MDFNDFLNQAWNDHATDSVQVAANLSEGLKLINQENQIAQMAQLVTHVLGEHLGRWNDGVQALQQLKQMPAFKIGTDGDKAITRSIASLELASGKRSNVEDVPTSEQIRVLTIAASALSEQRHIEKAQTLFHKAVEIAQLGLPKEDPANRALAVTGNNLACALEERSSRSSAETELMILAAQTARKYWEIAGTWLEVERAEYRLAMSYLKSGDLVRSLKHAQIGLEIMQENNAPALEFFFGYEALALAEKAKGNAVGFTMAYEQAKANFEKLSEDDKSWCILALTNLEI